MVGIQIIFVATGPLRALEQVAFAIIASDLMTVLRLAPLAYWWQSEAAR